MIQEQIFVTQKSVYCEGLEANEGHPRVFLDLTKAQHVICPYCSRKYIYKCE